jgi:DNA invertase Pin-like site-specific DNA recombinase
MTVKGYARVSTDGQTLEVQHEVQRQAGATQVFSERQSGAKTDRAALARCLASLSPGDTVVVTKLDRLARSTRDLLNTLDTIAKAGASFRSLGDPQQEAPACSPRLSFCNVSDKKAPIHYAGLLNEGLARGSGDGWAALRPPS